MPYEPQTRESRRQETITTWTGEDSDLSNFAPHTPNWVIADNHGAEWRVQDHLTLAVQLSGWIETAGGPVDEGDLRDLNIDPEPVDLALLNSLMQDEDLDALAALVGVTRDPGSKSQGEVVFGTVDSEVTIPSGTLVATPRGGTETEDRRHFYTTETVSPNIGETTVRAHIEANEVGIEWNVGAGQISELPMEVTGVEGVINPEPTSGGTEPESNDELRERAQSAPTETSGGGTASGVEGEVVAAIGGVTRDNVEVIEHHDPPDTDPGPFDGNSYAEVVVDGGIDSEVREVIDEAKPTAVGHVLVRPTELRVDVTATALAQYDAADIDTERIGDEVAGYISELGLGDDLYESQLIEVMMDADEDVANVPVADLSVTINDTVVSGDYAVTDKEVLRMSSVSINAGVIGG